MIHSYHFILFIQLLCYHKSTGIKDQMGFKMKNIERLCFFCLLFTLSACTYVTVIPKTKDTQTVIANAATENGAVKIASHQAYRICFLKNKTVKKIVLDTIYQGDSAKQKELIKMAKTILPKDKTSGNYTPEDYTYKAELTFKCI